MKLVSIEDRIGSRVESAYLLGLLLWDEVACALDEDVCPVALLVNDTRE